MRSKETRYLTISAEQLADYLREVEKKSENYIKWQTSGKTTITAYEVGWGTERFERLKAFTNAEAKETECMEI